MVYRFYRVIDFVLVTECDGRGQSPRHEHLHPRFRHHSLRYYVRLFVRLASVARSTRNRSDTGDQPADEMEQGGEREVASGIA